eukprot:tig00020603_g11790.t1
MHARAQLAPHVDPVSYLAALARISSLREAVLLVHDGTNTNPGRITALLRALNDALSRLPRLEKLRLDWTGFGAVVLHKHAAIRRAVTDLEVSVDPPWIPGAVRQLAEAISSLPRLEKITMKLERRARAPRRDPRSRPDLEAVAALLGCPGARRALVHLDLELDRPLAEAEASAIPALPALRLLHVESVLSASSPAPPHELRLAEGLSREVAVSFDLRNGGADPRLFEEAKAAVERAARQHRRQYWY